MIGVDRTRLQGAREFLDYTEKLLCGQHRSLTIVRSCFSPVSRTSRSASSGFTSSGSPSTTSSGTTSCRKPSSGSLP
jgi:hypothetical protein